MSSIFGKCNIANEPISGEDLLLMQDTLNHWNADYKGLWVNDYIGLGNIALYNTPESINEQQPLSDSLARFTITADIRLYNREDLYPVLRITTPEEKQISDTAIVLQLYKKYGAGCINYLIGDFAFAIWDEPQNQLFCARDHMGVRPFFYYHNNGFFAFATEKKGILCLPYANKAINKQFFYNQALGPRVQAANTTFHLHIHRLPPAHVLVFEQGKDRVSLNKYWTLDAFKEPSQGKKEDYYEGLKYHFEQAVQCRLRSAYPIGAELSGGLDSSAITGVASSFLRNSGNNILTFTNAEDIDNKDEIDEITGFRERPLSEEVINFNQITNFQYITKGIWENLVDEVDFSLEINDGPELQSLAWELPIKQAAKNKHVRTLLSGFGGDQMVTYRGQFNYLNYLDHKQYLKYFMSVNTMPLNRLKQLLPASIDFYLHKIKNFLVAGNDEIKLLSELLHIPGTQLLNRGDVVWQDINYLERNKSYRHYQKYRLLKPEVGLRMEAESRQGLYYRLEPRYPMADIRLTQYYLSLPNELKNEGSSSRFMFKNAIASYLPPMIMNCDDKTGSVAPFRATKTMVANRIDLTLHLLESLYAREELKRLILAKSFKFKYIQQSLPELLRWCEKNLGNY